MSAVRLRMSQADKTMWGDWAFYKNKGISRLRKHMRYRSVLQACVLRPREGWYWTQEMIDTLRCCGSRNFEVVGARIWGNSWASVEIHHAQA